MELAAVAADVPLSQIIDEKEYDVGFPFFLRAEGEANDAPSSAALSASHVGIASVRIVRRRRRGAKDPPAPPSTTHALSGLLRDRPLFEPRDDQPH